MVVGDDQINAGRLERRRFLDVGGTAVDGNHQSRARAVELADRLEVQAIAFGFAEGNVGFHHAAERFNGARHHRGCADAIGIVVTIHDDAFFFFNRPQDPVGCFFHINKKKRIMEIRGVVWLEEPLDDARFGDVAVGQQLQHHRIPGRKLVGERWVNGWANSPFFQHTTDY